MRGTALALLCLASLAACEGGEGGGVRSLSLLDAQAVVQAPEGYCVDTRASRPQTGFAVIAACGTVLQAEAVPSLPAMMTVQFGEAGSASVAGAEAQMQALLASADGAALLSRNGDPALVDLHDARSQPGLVVVNFSDRRAATAAAAGVGPEEWRAFLDLRGRLVTISLRSLAWGALTQTQARQLLAEAVATLRTANPGSGA
jgi:hypothetical protein